MTYIVSGGALNATHSLTYERAGLIINTNKTKILSSGRPASIHPHCSRSFTLTVRGDTLNATQQFTYLGSVAKTFATIPFSDNISVVHKRSA